MRSRAHSLALNTPLLYKANNELDHKIADISHVEPLRPKWCRAKRVLLSGLRFVLRSNYRDSCLSCDLNSLQRRSLSWEWCFAQQWELCVHPGRGGGAESHRSYLVLEETQPTSLSLEMKKFQLWVHATTLSVFSQISFLWFPECHVPHLSWTAWSCVGTCHGCLSLFNPSVLKDHLLLHSMDAPPLQNRGTERLWNPYQRFCLHLGKQLVSLSTCGYKSAWHSATLHWLSM